MYLRYFGSRSRRLNRRTAAGLIVAGLVITMMLAGTPAYAQHDHSVSVPVTIGPLVLRIILLAAVPVVAGFAMMRGFLPEPDRTTLKWVAIMATTAVLLEFMLAGGIDIPSQAAVLVLATLAVPVYLVVSRSRRAGVVAGHARRIAPWVLSLACGVAFIEFVRGWLLGRAPEASAVSLHTGLVLALTGLTWLTVGLPRARVSRIVILVESAVLAAAAVAAAGHATVLRPPDSSAPRAAAAYHVASGPVTGRNRSMPVENEEPAGIPSVMEQMNSLMLTAPGLAAPADEVADWYARKARLLEHIAAAGGPDAEFAHDLAAAAHEHSATLRRNAA